MINIKYIKRTDHYSPVTCGSCNSSLNDKYLFGIKIENDQTLWNRKIFLCDKCKHDLLHKIVRCQPDEDWKENLK